MLQSYALYSHYEIMEREVAVVENIRVVVYMHTYKRLVLLCELFFKI